MQFVEDGIGFLYRVWRDAQSVQVGAHSMHALSSFERILGCDFEK